MGYVVVVECLVVNWGVVVSMLVVWLLVGCCWYVWDDGWFVLLVVVWYYC